MLRFLGVRHLAVIEQLEMEFEPGLNILTGETGAGKSVLMEAIALAAGGRVTHVAGAPAWWTLADPEGNEVCIAVSPGREELWGE